MNATPDHTTGSTEETPADHGPSRVKIWIFFALFFTVAMAMYAGTMYRIQNYGYTGIGQDRLAHPPQHASQTSKDADAGTAPAAAAQAPRD